MAKIQISVINALRNTAKALEKSSSYQWGHMGACNCGFLAQEITRFRKEEIHARAMQHYGDWNDQLNDYCTTTGLPMNEIISEMIAAGFDVDDLKHLEKLSDPEILDTFHPDSRHLAHNLKRDVVKYLNAWADLLEAKFISNVKIPADINTAIIEESV